VFEKILCEPGRLNRLLREPPFRLFIKEVLRNGPFSIRIKAHWDAVPRPHYLHGVLVAAEQAKRQGITDISVIEFGVARGAGLLELQAMADSVEKHIGTRIHVFGFDTGRGLPESTGDFRDHPETWITGDFPMDEASLRSRLGPKTSLVIGNIADTVPQFVRESHPHIGFIAVDVDFYSSTRQALRILVLPGTQILHRVLIYLDDVVLFHNHKFAGELLAIEEFNAENERVKVDIWRGLEKNRPFFDSMWIKQMYVAHDLAALGRRSISRAVSLEP
jgi:hypothetical protein